MNANSFDSLKLARGFEAAGMSPVMANGSAEALAVAMKDADCATKAVVALVRTKLQGVRTELKADIASLRTELKGDIAHLRTELKGDIASLRGEMDLRLAAQNATIAAFQASVKSDFAAVAASFDLLRRDMTIKLGGMIFLATGLMVAAMRFIPPPH